MYYEMNDKK